MSYAGRPPTPALCHEPMMRGKIGEPFSTRVALPLDKARHHRDTARPGWRFVHSSRCRALPRAAAGLAALDKWWDSRRPSSLSAGAQGGPSAVPLVPLE